MKRNHFPKMLNGQVITEQSISSGLNLLLKYGVEEKEKRSSFSSTKKALQEELPPKVNVTVQKRSSKPFTPTAVPSPVHGFINPRREATTTSKVEEVNVATTGRKGSCHRTTADTTG